VRTPPDAITAHFGPGSCRRHIEDAQTNFQKYRLATLPGLTADIDTPEEARRFLSLVDRLGRNGRTSQLLREYLR
jgi:2-phospho-L-lactate guanylyltransferase (CobY/MobA/RfbA family)